MILRRLTSVFFSGVILSLPTLAAAEYVGPNAMQTSTVKELLDTGIDDQPATLEGRVTKRTGTDHYAFEDGTGSLDIEIKPHIFPTNSPIDAQAPVEIIGKLDREMLGHTKFDVKQLRRLP